MRGGDQRSVEDQRPNCGRRRRRLATPERIHQGVEDRGLGIEEQVLLRPEVVGHGLHGDVRRFCDLRQGDVLEAVAFEQARCAV